MKEPTWTHKGLFCGLVPVKLAHLESECPDLTGRWFWCDWLLDIVTPLFGLFCVVMELLNPNFDPEFPIRITGKLGPE